MARSKNATALFEVIHAAKKPPKSSTSVSVPTPKWWAKSKPAASKPAGDVAETAGKQGSWLAAAAKRGVLPTSAHATDTPMPARVDEADAAVDSYDDSMHAQVDSAVAEIPVGEPRQHELPKPRFAERFAERFARKAAAAAAVPAPVEPEPSVEIPEKIESETETFNMDVEAPAALPAVKKTKRSRAEKDAAVAVNRGAKEVQFRLSYGGLISIAFILVMILALAVLIGSHFASSVASDTQDDQKKSSDSAGSSANLLAYGSAATPATPSTPVGAAGPADTQPPRPDVLAVPRHPAKSGVAAPDAQRSARSAAPAASTLLDDRPRTVGATYVIAQNYDDKQIAQKACDYLNKNGIKCSVVQGLGGWAPRDWYSVVGLWPFKANDENLKEYQHKVTQLGLKFSNKVYNQFEPKAYTWTTDSDEQGSDDRGNVDGAQ